MRNAARRMWGAAATTGPFSDNFNRADGPVGNGWTTYSFPSGVPAISSNVVAGGTVPTSGSHAWELSRVLSTTPSFAQSGYNGPANNMTFHVFCGTTDGGAYSSLTGVSGATDGQALAYIFTWAAGVPTLRASGSVSAASGTLKISKSGTTYTVSVNASPIANWTGTASWGTSVGLIASLNSGFSMTIDNYSSDGNA